MGWGDPRAAIHPKFASPENGVDGAATMVLVHAGPSGGELDITGFPIIHPVNFPTFHVGQMFAEHPGGGNVCLGDGSVHFFNENLDLITFAELVEGDDCGYESWRLAVSGGRCAANDGRPSAVLGRAQLNSRGISLS